MIKKSDNTSTGNPDGPLQEGRDFILENGLMVLTADYLLRRGYCCNSGCRNCPYKDMDPVRTEAPK